MDWWSHSVPGGPDPGPGLNARRWLRGDGWCVLGMVEDEPMVVALGDARQLGLGATVENTALEVRNV